MKAGNPRANSFSAFYRVTEPDPVNDKRDVPRDAVLGWKGGTGAVSHDVYLGTMFALVDQATTTLDPLAIARV